MAELLKNIYNEKFFEQFTKSVKTVFPRFNKKSFLKAIYDSEWEGRELKQRMRHITLVLQKLLTNNYKKNTTILLKLIPILKKNGFANDNLEFIFFPDFIEVFGLDSYSESVKVIERITQFVTCEFAIRPFILKYPDKMLQQMHSWSNHKHASVRRLASEGCRPRLPWAMALPFLKEDPKPILPILDNLKNDPSEYVRRSVANNLNDISKDNPAIVIGLVKKWKGKNSELDALVKHASRTLLKQGNMELMELFGFGSIQKIKIDNFKVLTSKVKVGEYLEFSFKLINKNKVDSKLRLEYGLYYQKANGSLSKKVFKISEKDYPGNSETAIHRRQSFKIITTRKFHPGLHQVSLIINGKELETHDFQLSS